MNVINAQLDFCDTFINDVYPTLPADKPYVEISDNKGNVVYCKLSSNGNFVVLTDKVPVVDRLASVSF